MIPRGPSWGAILRVNAKLAYAAFLGLLAWLGWQFTNPTLWALGALAIIIALSAAFLAITALAEIVGLVLRDREVAELERQGRVMKSDGLANTARLRERDMLR